MLSYQTLKDSDDNNTKSTSGSQSKRQNPRRERYGRLRRRAKAA
jgi:hypothetical protein